MPKLMRFSFLQSTFQRFRAQQWHLLNAAIWTLLLTLTVALAAFPPIIAFVSAITPSSSFSSSCYVLGSVRIPLDSPGHTACLPSYMVSRSTADFFVPTLFAALIVACSAFVVRSFGFSEEY